jgi:hypothetical protein
MSLSFSALSTLSRLRAHVGTPGRQHKAAARPQSASTQPADQLARGGALTLRVACGSSELRVGAVDAPDDVLVVVEFLEEHDLAKRALWA